jgi:hypothetical protein
MPVRIMNSASLNSKNIMNKACDFKDIVAMNSIPWNNTKINSVCCKFYQDEPCFLRIVPGI